MTEKEIRRQAIKELEQRLYKIAQLARPIGWNTFSEVVTSKNISMVVQDMLEEGEK